MNAESPPTPRPRIPTRPRGPLKWLYNAPRVLYRLRLGWLLGRRFLLLTHRGRTSGRPRRTVLEVVRYDRAARESVVISAYGERADWYRNIQASPAIEVRTGGRRYTPETRELGVDERYAALETYYRRYRRLFGAFMRFMGYAYTGQDEELRAIAASVRMVAFRPREGG